MGNRMVINGNEAPVKGRRQQGGGSVMKWPEIIGDELLGPVSVPQGVKLASATYCQFLKNVIEAWLEEAQLSRLKKVVFLHDNVSCHAAKATTKCLEILGFAAKFTRYKSSNQGKRLYCMMGSSFSHYMSYVN